MTVTLHLLTSPRSSRRPRSSQSSTMGISSVDIGFGDAQTRYLVLTGTALLLEKALPNLHWTDHGDEGRKVPYQELAPVLIRGMRIARGYDGPAFCAAQISAGAFDGFFQCIHTLEDVACSV